MYPRPDSASGGENADRNAEARRILFDMGLEDVVDAMSPKEQSFVNSLLEKFEQYEDSTFVSSKQIFWLRDLKEKYL